MNSINNIMSSETNKKNEFDFIKEQLRPLTYGKKEARNYTNSKKILKKSQKNII